MKNTYSDNLFNNVIGMARNFLINKQFKSYLSPTILKGNQMHIGEIRK